MSLCERFFFFNPLPLSDIVQEQKIFTKTQSRRKKKDHLRDPWVQLFKPLYRVKVADSRAKDTNNWSKDNVLYFLLLYFEYTTDQEFSMKKY